MKRRKHNIDPDVFLHAAELIDAGNYSFSCHAIDSAKFGSRVCFEAVRPSPEQDFFTRTFLSDAKAMRSFVRERGSWFMLSFDEWIGISIEERRNIERDHRVFALLLCYELALDLTTNRRTHWPLHRGQPLRAGDEWFDGSRWIVREFIYPGERYKTYLGGGRAGKHLLHRRAVGSRKEAA